MTRICRQLQQAGRRIYQAASGAEITTTLPRDAASRRFSSTLPSDSTLSSEPADFSQILSRPTWSVRSLLPPDSTSAESPGSERGEHHIVTPSQLHHLLRLSALPLPQSKEEEAGMTRVLHDQLHFVRDIQGVDTSGVAPLSAIRDETAAGRREQTIGLAQLQGELSSEVPFGRCGRPRRCHSAVTNSPGVEPWDAFQAAPQKAGRYFVAKSHGPE